MDAKTIKDFISIIKEDKTTVGPYDTTATVVRVEGSTAWVHIPGGVDETPVAMSVNVQAGDTVRVRVSGGQAWVTGNDTAPPTDDAVAKVAKIQAEEANETAVFAIKQAEDASGVANNYLSSDNTGMMVADMAGGSPESPSEATTKNVFIDNDSVDIRDGQTVLASFGNKARIGKMSENNIEIESEEIVFNAIGDNEAIHMECEARIVDGETRYDARLTNPYNLSYISIAPDIVDDEYSNYLTFSSEMSDYSIHTTGGAGYGGATVSITKGDIHAELRDGSYVSLVEDYTGFQYHAPDQNGDDQTVFALHPEGEVDVLDAAKWRDTLGFGGFKHVATDRTQDTSPETFTYTLESAGIYVIIIDKINTTSTSYAGLYIAGIHSSNSNVKAISSATSATVSASGTTLTITLSSTYMKAAIYKIA